MPATALGTRRSAPGVATIAGTGPAADGGT
jgi:hypothetical protein